MRTRRSVRNQNILYRQLFPAPPKPVPLAPTPYAPDDPVLFGKSPKRRAQLVRMREQEIARYKLRQLVKERDFQRLNGEEVDPQ